jgi:hypothetical protein
MSALARVAQAPELLHHTVRDMPAADRRALRAVDRACHAAVEEWAAARGGRADARGSAFAHLAAHAARAAAHAPAATAAPPGAAVFAHAGPDGGTLACARDGRVALTWRGYVRAPGPGAFEDAEQRFLASYHVVQVQTAACWVCVRTACGRVFLLGHALDGYFVRARAAPAGTAPAFTLPLPLRVRCVSVADMGAAGAGGCLAACANGHAYAWGVDVAGWLGLGHSTARRGDNPVRIPFFARSGLRVRAVAIGFRCDPIGLAVTEDGALYAWGGARNIATVNGMAHNVRPWGWGETTAGWRGDTPRRVDEPGASHAMHHVVVAAPPCRVMARDSRGKWHAAGLAMQDKIPQPMAPLRVPNQNDAQIVS